MASQGARADPVASREESWESTEGSIAPASAGGMEIDRESVGADAPIPPLVLQWHGYHQNLHRFSRWPSRPKHKLKHNFLHRRASTSSSYN
ncbi:UNVERIFIED_CONTAM: hypothetical protein Slati_0498500 [Sesamum latifolium]|uniref:Uncharacterized protein n=1 Tax=Sesamum latifolium TaxID=2727402 RepID=A0AAW2XX38_9LAMI